MTAYLNALGVICALGSGKAEVAGRLFAGDTSGMQVHPQLVAGRRLPVGAARCALPALPCDDPRHATRNNQLLLAAALEIESDIRTAISRYGQNRIGVVLGTSTTGIQEAAQGIAGLLHDGAFPPGYHYAHQELAAPASFLGEWLQPAGPRYAISTACTSSARAPPSAKRPLEAGLCEAALCGGADSPSDLTLQGFSALEATSETLCNPFSRNRNGINIGEAAVLFLMTRDTDGETNIALLGGGASSDAHHISAPDPDGRGALSAMRQALARANCTPKQIAYLNLHGTATPHNDAMESVAVAALFPHGVPCSSSKPLTGHTLGAAGALEAAFCWLSLSPLNPDQQLPPHRWDGEPGPALPALLLAAAGTEMNPTRPRRMLSNYFAFGGNNISLILGDAR